MTLREIEERLRLAGVPDAAFDARCLAAHFTGYSDAYLMAARDEELSAPGLEAAVCRRETREPLQYILGVWDFMGGSYEVNPHCLIPRADTEILVEKALSLLPPAARVADLCTGSGCIAVALASLGGAQVTAVELIPETADLAVRNAERNGVSHLVTVRRGDVTEDVFSPDEIFDMIVSNPPYVTVEEMKTLEKELSFEPAVALTDGGDGLSVLSAIVRLYPRHVRPGGYLLLEHGSLEGASVRAMAEKMGLPAETVRDLAGLERCTVIGPMP